MKVRKIIARNMSEGLRAISAELGEDAMILSNRKVPQGVEILAAVKPDAEVPEPKPVPRNRNPASSQPDAGMASFDQPDLAMSAMPPQRPASRPQPAPEESLEDSIIRMSERDNGGLSRESLMSLLDKHKDPLEQKRRKLREQLSEQNGRSASVNAAPRQREASSSQRTLNQPGSRKVASPTPIARKAVDAPAQSHAPNNRADNPAQQQELSAMREELASLRYWLESSEYRGQEAQGNPHPLYKRLKSLAFDPRCVAPMVEKYREVPLDQAWTKSTDNLGRIIGKHATCLIRKGGVAALVGPTGAGKTTTLSKIATRFAMQHGAQDLGIISLDQFRIGAHEPVRILGRILGCEVILSDAQDELEQHLASMGDKKLILIDTNGSERGLQSFRDQLGGSVLESQIQPMLVLPANLSTRSVEQAWERFSVLRPRGLVLTKADESVEIGTVLSLSLRKKIPLTYWSNGTMVPQDLHFGEVSDLIARSFVQLDQPASGEKLVRIG